MAPGDGDGDVLDAGEGACGLEPADLFEDAAARLQISNLVLQQTCEALSARGYIEPDIHIVRGPEPVNRFETLTGVHLL